MKSISEILEKYGMNIKQLSDRFGIPYRTVQNWKADGTKNKRECPDYILNMMDEILSKEN